MTAPLRQKGTEEMAEGISQGIKAQRMRPRSTCGPDSQGAGRPFHSTGLLCCGALGKGLEVPRSGSRVAQHWVREGNVALASYCRAFGRAQPDGRERRPGSSQKHSGELCPGLESHMGTWLRRGPFRLKPSWLPGIAKPASCTRPGLLMRSVPATTHWIRFWTNKTSIPSHHFHVWFRRHFKIPEPWDHCFQVTKSSWWGRKKLG